MRRTEKNHCFRLVRLFDFRREVFQQRAIKPHIAKPIKRKPFIPFAFRKTKILFYLTFRTYKLGMERAIGVCKPVLPCYSHFIFPDWAFSVMMLQGVKGIVVHFFTFFLQHQTDRPKSLKTYRKSRPVT